MARAASTRWFEASLRSRSLVVHALARAAFEAEYGYPLAVPETWAQLMDIAKFFTRPDEGLYGAAIYTQLDYDALTMGVHLGRRSPCVFAEHL